MSDDGIERRLVECWGEQTFLHPTLVRERMDELIRGGLPGASMSQGSPSANKPDPKFDGDDVRMMKALTAYNDDLKGMDVALAKFLDHARAARQRETGVVPELHMASARYAEYRQKMARAAVEEVGPRAQDCANPNCRRPVERNQKDRLKGGRCLPCYDWLREHHAERPRHLCAADIERMEIKKVKKASKSAAK